MHAYRQLDRQAGQAGQAGRHTRTHARRHAGMLSRHNHMLTLVHSSTRSLRKDNSDQKTDVHACAS